MTNDKLKIEIQKIKDLTYFMGMINNLPEPKKRDNKLNSDEKIPVILSADNNYSCFVATTGASILYNTTSFIEFYILSEGITEENKNLIIKTFSDITTDFSIEFIECNSEEYFSNVKMSKGSHIKLNTCNRLLFPMFAPKVERAIYLDVDIIVIGDIKELWEEDLDGYIIGAAPLYISRNRSVDNFLRQIDIPKEALYHYFNSGVMLIDYAKWKEKEGSGKNIADSLIKLTKEVNPKCTPDELILNKYAYTNGGYKELSHKYNVNPYYSYKWLCDNKNFLNSEEKKYHWEFESYIKRYNYYDSIPFEGEPLIRHFFGMDKPWHNYTQRWFYLPYTPHFEDFWFYAKITPYFKQIKQMFISKQMYTDNLDEIIPLNQNTQTTLQSNTDKSKGNTDKFYKNSLQKIFSVKNQKAGKKKYKIITIAGARIKLKQTN